MSLSLVGQMDMEELSDWTAFLYGEYDLDNLRKDQRSALLCAITHNSHADRKRPVGDFMPKKKTAIKDKSVIRLQLMAWVSENNQAFKRRRKK
jgi:hypothetical protein